MESLLPLISFITLCLSAAGLYLLYRAQMPGRPGGAQGQNAAWLKEKKRRQQQWGMGLLIAGFAGGVITLYFMA